MNRNRKGQLAIFDALIFLTVATIVSESLIGVIASSRTSTDLEVQTFVERAHWVFLRTTLGPKEPTTQMPEIEDNKTLTVFEFVVSELLKGDESGTVDQREIAKVRLSDILDGLLMPGLHYSWKAVHNSTTLSISSPSSSGSSSGDLVYVSTVISDMPMHEGGIVLRLSAFRVSN
jgi:hypothetical protein